MIAIALDSNVWIYIAKSKYSATLKNIKKIIEKKEAVILINGIVKKEWDRNEDQTKKDFAHVVKAFYNEAKLIKDLLPKDHYQTDCQSFFSKIQGTPTWIDDIVDRRISMIKDIMSLCEDVPYTDKQKLYVADLAIEKKGPFIRNKNNFNDALILRSFSEHVEKNPDIYNEFIFATNNEKDFIDSSTNKIYPEIIKDINVTIDNVKDFAEALKKLPDVIESEQLDNEIDSWIDWQAEIAMGR